MPFDGSVILDKSVPFTVATDCFETLLLEPTLASIRPRPIPAWRISRGPGGVRDTVAVLTRARALIADKRRWCKRAYAVGFLGIPVSTQSIFVRRYCALGAIRRAGWELGLSVQDAGSVLEWQTRIPVPNWNDNRRRTHPEVIAEFDAAIAALEAVPG